QCRVGHRTHRREPDRAARATLRSQGRGAGRAPGRDERDAAAIPAVVAGAAELDSVAAGAGAEPGAADDPGASAVAAEARNTAAAGRRDETEYCDRRRAAVALEPPALRRGGSARGRAHYPSAPAGAVDRRIDVALDVVPERGRSG